MKMFCKKLSKAFSNNFKNIPMACENTSHQQMSVKTQTLGTVLFFFLALLGTGCNQSSLPEFLSFKEKAADSELTGEPLARVYNAYLYPEDIEGIVSLNTSSADSVSIVNRYIDAWIRKQLLIAEAASQINFDEAEMERKVLDYRYALMTYEFEKYYVNERVQREVNEDEIQEYYDTHKDNFQLKQNIIKGIFVKIPQEAPRIGSFRKLFREASDDKDKEQIKSYCYSFATTYSLEDSLWLNFEDIIQNTPLASIPNKVQFLQQNKFIETSDENYVYFLKVSDYKISDQISPLEFVKDDIVNIIINKRKIELTDKLEENIYKEAQDNDDFEIFNPTENTTADTE